MSFKVTLANCAPCDLKQDFHLKEKWTPIQYSTFTAFYVCMNRFIWNNIQQKLHIFRVAQTDPFVTRTKNSI